VTAGRSGFRAVGEDRWNRYGTLDWARIYVGTGSFLYRGASLRAPHLGLESPVRMSRFRLQPSKSLKPPPKRVPLEQVASCQAARLGSGEKKDLGGWRDLRFRRRAGTKSGAWGSGGARRGDLRSTTSGSGVGGLWTPEEEDLDRQANSQACPHGDGMNGPGPPPARLERNK